MPLSYGQALFLVGVLLKRAGGHVQIPVEEMKAVAGREIHCDWDSEGPTTAVLIRGGTPIDGECTPLPVPALLPRDFG